MSSTVLCTIPDRTSQTAVPAHLWFIGTRPRQSKKLPSVLVSAMVSDSNPHPRCVIVRSRSNPHLSSGWPSSGEPVLVGARGVVGFCAEWRELQVEVRPSCALRVRAYLLIVPTGCLQCERGDMPLAHPPNAGMAGIVRRARNQPARPYRAQPTES